jgi:hypothetical protein
MDFNYNHLDPNDPTKVLPVETVGPWEQRPQTGASNYMVNAGVYYDTKPVSLSLVYNYVSNRMFRPARYYSESLFERPLEALDAQLAVRFLNAAIKCRQPVEQLFAGIPEPLYRPCHQQPYQEAQYQRPAVPERTGYD